MPGGVSKSFRNVFTVGIAGTACVVVTVNVSQKYAVVVSVLNNQGSVAQLSVVQLDQPHKEEFQEPAICIIDSMRALQILQIEPKTGPKQIPLLLLNNHFEKAIEHEAIHRSTLVAHTHSLSLTHIPMYTHIHTHTPTHTRTHTHAHPCTFYQ